MSEVYTHGHHESVLRSHAWRTAENSAAYLLPHLRPGMRILDVGCGPGTITAGLARYVPGGSVTGIDSSAAVVARARGMIVDNSKKGGAGVSGDSGKDEDGGISGDNSKNEGGGGAGTGSGAGNAVADIDFAVGDVYALDYPDDSFCVTHAHQVLQHLSDPVRALREMRRVTRPGGLIAVRDADYGGMLWYPRLDGMNEWGRLYQAVARSNGGEPDGGRHLHVWARRAGLTDITMSSSTWTYAMPEDRAWWGGLWAERTVKSDTAAVAIANGLATREDLERIAGQWRSWAAHQDGWFCVVNGEVLARVLPRPGLDRFTAPMAGA